MNELGIEVEETVGGQYRGALIHKRRSAETPLEYRQVILSTFHSADAAKVAVDGVIRYLQSSPSHSQLNLYRRTN